MPSSSAYCVLPPPRSLFQQQRRRTSVASTTSSDSANVVATADFYGGGGNSAVASCAGGDEDARRLQQQHPLQAATNALLDVGGLIPSTSVVFSSAAADHYATRAVLSWGGDSGNKSLGVIDSTKSLLCPTAADVHQQLSAEHFIQQHQQHDEQQLHQQQQQQHAASVVRLAVGGQQHHTPSLLVKMEDVNVTSAIGNGVGVIKTAPPTSFSKILHTTSLGPVSTALSPKMEIIDQQQLSNSVANMSVLQELPNMKPPHLSAYDPYAQIAPMYRPVYANYSGDLSGFAPPPSGQSATILTAATAPGYPNLLGNNLGQCLSADQDIYYQPQRTSINDAAAYYTPIDTSIYGGMHQRGHEELINFRLNRSYNKPVTVDMPSPDSGIGIASDLGVTPSKDHNADGFVNPYADLQPGGLQHQPQSLTSSTGGVAKHHQRPSTSSERSLGPRDSPVHIPKLMNSLGFQYILEAPVSTSIRKDDDRMTYINKGQFYTVTLDYIPDPTKPLKSTTVKTIVMAVFREEKVYEEEMKCWSFWHSRQHSLKQRILDVDNKNTTGIVGPVEEVAHNAIQFYWNPSEMPVKVSVAVQCLSTDFSNQKGVKGLPLHLQIDTYDEAADSKQLFHRGYCQIKVFCDKGANRKMLHEQRRDEKRKLQDLQAQLKSCSTAVGGCSALIFGGGFDPEAAADTHTNCNRQLEQFNNSCRKRSDGEYHEPCDRSEFYHMSNLEKPAALFVCPDDYDGAPGRVGAEGGASDFVPQAPPTFHMDPWMSPIDQSLRAAALGLDPSRSMDVDDPTGGGVKVDSGDDATGAKRRCLRSPNVVADRLMLYCRKQDEQVFTPLHLTPPGVDGLKMAVANKYGLLVAPDGNTSPRPPTLITGVFKQSRKGITVRIDDEMLKHYCNEDTFILDIERLDNGCFEVTLIELDVASSVSPPSTAGLNNNGSV